MEEIYVSISKLKGGYILSLPTGQRVETSLNKVMSLVRDTMKQELTEEVVYELPTLTHQQV